MLEVGKKLKMSCTAFSQTYKSYAEGYSESSWLSRMLTGEDQMHYQKIMGKIDVVVIALRKQQRHLAWPEEADKKLDAFEAEIAASKQEYDDHLVRASGDI